MSEMVERVARALCRADGVNPDADFRICGSVFLTVAVPEGEAQQWRTRIRQARAAIEAMREPTTKMEVTGCGNDQCGPMCTEYVWGAMIDKALK